MPNWCASRLSFSGIEKDIKALKAWICGDGVSLHRRAVKEGIQLFLAGCADILRPVNPADYPPFPALTASGVTTTPNNAAQAYSDWLAMFITGAELDAGTCGTLHQHWLECGIQERRWATLNDAARAVIEELYQRKWFDWSDGFRSETVDIWWDRLCGDDISLFPAVPMDFRDVLPGRLDIEVNGFNGDLLAGIPSSYDHYLCRYGCKWPVGYEANICFATERGLKVDFDTPWSPPADEVVVTLSRLYDSEVEHWFAEQGCDYCGYARYVNGEADVSVTDALEWGEADPDDEDSFPEVTGPEWLINNIAHFGG